MNNEFEFPEPESTPAPKRGRGKSAKDTAPVEEAAEPTVNTIDGGSPEFDELELEQLFDDLMFNGSYYEEVKIGKRFTVGLKTRTGKDAREVMNVLDKAGYHLGLTVESVRSLYNLAQSVVIVNGRDISGEVFDKKVELLEELPTPVLSAMIVSLMKFDRKVEAAVRHGEENF